MNNVTRTPITVATDNGVSLGKWFPFPIDESVEKPTVRGLNSDNMLLWCPYCKAWHVFKRRYNSSQEGLVCTGQCGWANTNDFYVRKYNRMWGDGK